MENELYNRQSKMKLNIPSEVIIIGCGGASWTALILAMLGTKKLTLYDDDVIELSNCNRQYFKPSQVGMYKVNALKENILEFRPDCEIIANKIKVDELIANSLPKCTWINGTDNLKSKRMICEKNPLNTMVVIAEGNDYNILTGTEFIEEFKDVISVRSGYTHPQQHIVNNLLCDVLAIQRIIKGEEDE